MNSVYIYHHLGLGDHFICNGLVRTIYKKYDRTFLFCKPKNFKNIAFLYQDLNNLKIIAFDDNDVHQFMLLNPLNNYLIVGHEKLLGWPKIPEPNGYKSDERFYYLADVPLENKWKEFYVKRDIEREKQIYAELGLKDNEEYAFVHDDSRQITKNITNIRIIKPDKMEYSPFDYLYTIERAKEIHCIDSSFFCLIECIGINKDNMYLHQYARTDMGPNVVYILRSNWKILN